MPRLARILSRHLTHERLDGEVIIINLQTGLYFSLSGSAADLWSLADDGLPVEQWISALDGQFSSPVMSEDIEGFLGTLMDNGLVEILESSDPMPGRSIDLPDDYARGAWTGPVLEVFEDLQDLILVDPIHDVSDDGWPYRDESN